jgi:uncharacterized protein CbrC (UPF0167 family)
MSDPTTEAVPARWLRRPAAAPESLEQEHRARVDAPWFLREHPELSSAGEIPFGYCCFEWQALKDATQPGDELWEFSSLLESGEFPSFEGIALVRAGKAVAAVETIQFHKQFNWELVDLAFTPRSALESRDDGTGVSLVFPLFQGPPSEMRELGHGPETCACCRRVARCFHGAAGAVCLTCLRAGAAEFRHATELGWICETGGEGDYEDDELADLAAELSPVAVHDFRRTPSYESCQEPLWLVHCNDFMVYHGAWQPAHFHYMAPDGDGRAFFHRIAGPEWDDWWELGADRLFGGYTPSSWGDAGCYAFRCRHCGTMRLHCDFY